MWTYHQLSGEIIAPDGTLVWRGYSGFGEGKNNPKMEHLKGIGPIPKGKYWIGPPYASAKVGPYALPLNPMPGTHTFGRSAFRIHGDSKTRKGEASTGCIIAPFVIRTGIWESDDHTLLVK